MAWVSGVWGSCGGMNDKWLLFGTTLEFHTLPGFPCKVSEVEPSKPYSAVTDVFLRCFFSILLLLGKLVQGPGLGTRI